MKQRKVKYQNSLTECSKALKLSEYKKNYLLIKPLNLIEKWSKN